MIFPPGSNQREIFEDILAAALPLDLNKEVGSFETFRSEKRAVFLVELEKKRERIRQMEAEEESDSEDISDIE